MTDKIPAVAIVGAGHRGMYSYGGYIEKHPEEGKVVAVAEPRKFYREETSRRHNIAVENQFESWEDLLSRDRLADAVIIATTDRDHTEPAVAAAKKGYHILLEKPMAATAEECVEITKAAKDAGVILTVCHVLRYAPFYTKVMEIIESGQIGDVCSIQHLEGIAWWHFAHSYVRGNFGNESRSSFSLLAKSCHDIDVLRWWAGRKCEKVSSFGHLSHFRSECAPEGAAERCMDCPLADCECAYSAKRFYFDKLGKGETGWPLAMVVEEPDEKSLADALRNGPYGRCVYYCDNDVVDTQIVNMDFEGGLSASMTMSAFTPHGRKVRVMGSRGWLEGQEHTIRVLDFFSGHWSEYDVNKLATDITGGHGGGDGRMMKAFLSAVGRGDYGGLTTGPDVTLESHLIVFAAEQARKEDRVIDMKKFC